MRSQSNGYPIALIVIGCLGAGLLLAVILVLLPFAGARENVISGVVLLAFAFGWARWPSSLCASPTSPSDGLRCRQFYRRLSG